jgi:hypothetical protein
MMRATVRVPAGGRWRVMLIFRAEWFKPIGELTSQQLGDYRSWLRRNMGRMPAQERQRAKEALQALTAERGVSRRQRDEIDASGPVDEGRRRRFERDRSCSCSRGFGDRAESGS